jgi:butyryl-CoA dehydrogenase
VDDEWCGRLEGALAALGSVTEHLGGLGMQGDVAGMLLHSADYMDLFSTVVIGWQWLKQAAVAKPGLDAGRATPAFYEGKLCAAQYWINTELPRAGYLAALCRSGEDSYARIKPEWF